MSELRIAARIRAERGATQVGVAYTEENIGFIHILDEDWPTALEHTQRIDDILPLAWNLTVRHIAARENEAALRQAGASQDALDYMETIQDETAMVLSLMDCDQIDKPELQRLLPARFEETVESLSAHCVLEAERS